jgi:pSer/pThr/pTyr-binding forkhead associated (FHA) protein
MIRITAISGDGKGKSQEYSSLPISIGRYTDNDIVITDSIVSRRHCIIASDGLKISVIDLGSKNGTYVNGSRFSDESVLLNGDVITIGIINLQIEIDD